MPKVESRITIHNARHNNLKGVDATIPHESFTVVTGVSGSGKSSLVFDTLFAEGQRRYVESLSAYARQFLGRMKKPLVDNIEGLCPAIAIQQKVNTQNPRSTVATSTEIYDYLKLLFERVGHTISPISGKEVKRDTVSDVYNAALSYEDGTMLLVTSPITKKDESYEMLLQKGFVRVLIDGEMKKIESLMGEKIEDRNKVDVIIDRIKINKSEEETNNRLFDSIETAFWEGGGECTLYDYKHKSRDKFNNRFELDGIIFDIPTKDFLSFNNPYGACKTCEGFGSTLGIDPDLVIPDPQLSLYEGCIAPWRGEIMGEWKDHFIKSGLKFDFPIHRPYAQLNKQEKDLLWDGNDKILGIRDFFKHLEENNYKIQYRVMAARYRGKTTCTDCKGTRLRKEASYVKLIHNRKKEILKETSIQEVLLMTVSEATHYFQYIELTEHDHSIAYRIINEIANRLSYLEKVGLGYLTLNRLSNSLSGGESQRINLATNLGSSLTGSMYILDEPSIGLHSRDTDRLIEVLKTLQKEGNTVIVVEHDEEMMRQSDYLIDIGPKAGNLGGEKVFEGDFTKFIKNGQSLTAEYLTGKRIIQPKDIRKSDNFIELSGVSANNLKGIDMKFPLETLTCVSGVSGSGKTTLIKHVLFPVLSRELKQFSTVKPGAYHELNGATHLLKAVEFVDQNPIGKSSRSNPVTYIKAYDEIRELYANTPNAKRLGFKPSHFSFNVDGGRCDNCQGEGETVIEMQFMADIKIPCEVCEGRRFKKDVLGCRHNQKNIFDVLEMTVDEAIEFFKGTANISQRLKPLQDVGLGYVKLGQGSNTLSGGEAQRVKLAYYLSKATPFKEGGVLFVFDEPTTGLHFYDIEKLLGSFDALIAKGNTVLCIEHNLDVIKCSDWIIDLGPEAGEKGGQLVFQGSREGLTKCKDSLTGAYLKQHLKNGL